MKELQRALSEIQCIRSQVARGTEFRGYGPASIALSGVLALLGAAMIVPLFIPARWRAAPGEGIEGIDEDGSDLPVTELLSAPPASHAAGPAGLSEPR